MGGKSRLMTNHFHLLVETPEANLVTGLKLLLGTFSQGWNRRRLIAQRLGMGHPGSVSRLVVEAAKDPARIRKLGKPGKMLKRDT